MATLKSTKKTTEKKTTATKRAPAKNRTATKKTIPKKANAEPEKKLSALAAAAKVLGETKDALNAREMIEQMSAKGYWTSPEGRTPHMTLYAAITREIKNKGRDARFKKAEPGRFTLNAKG